MARFKYVGLVYTGIKQEDKRHFCMAPSLICGLVCVLNIISVINFDSSTQAVPRVCILVL